MMSFTKTISYGAQVAALYSVIWLRRLILIMREVLLTAKRLTSKMSTVTCELQHRD